MMYVNKVAVGLISLSMTGCSMLNTLDSVEYTLSNQSAQAQGHLKSMKASASTGAVWRTSSAKLAGADVKVVPDERLPQAFFDSISYITSAQTFEAILNALGQRTGIPMRSETSRPLAQVSQSSGSGAPLAVVGFSQAMPVEWSGTLKGLLDHLAQRTGQYWKYQGGQVLFFTEETRSFHVYLPAGKRNMSASISLSPLGGGGSVGSSGSGGGSSVTSVGAGAAMGGSGGGNVSVSSEVDVNPYEAIIKGVMAIVQSEPSSGQPGIVASASAGGAATTSSSGSASPSSTGKVVASPDLGMITVTASPPVLDRVAEYVDTVNKRFAKNVLIDVKIFNVTMNDEANAGLSMDLLYRSLGPYSFNVVGQPLLQPKMGAPANLIIENTDPNAKMFNSQVLAQALSGLGKVALVTSGQVIAANGQPAPMQVANQITYLASTSMTQTVNVGATNTLTPGTVTVGFTANFLPMLIGDNRILLQYQINLSSMLALEQISSGGSSIQAPNIATQSLQQQAFLKDGQAIVLFGYENGRASSSSNLSFAGISRSGQSDRQMSVIVMQVYGGNHENI